MEVFGLLGFSLGSTAFTFAIIGWTQTAKLQKELIELKQELVEAGVKIKQDT